MNLPELSSRLSTRFRLLILPVILLLGSGCQGPGDTARLERLAFGSCARENRPQPIWDAIRTARPDLFLFIGDNIYGDTEDMEVMREKYARLGEIPEFAAFRKRTPILAIWDDHDYGVNDGGREYPAREASQRVFLEFFEEPEDSPRWKRPGLYFSKMVGPPGERVQIIVLDTRYFRSDLLPRPERQDHETKYLRNPDPAATILGEAQWLWLEQELTREAEFRLIVSSIQLLTDGQRGENWLNFPRERQRLFDLIRTRRAEGVIFLTGDSHYAEMARFQPEGLYPLHDLTSSSINQGWVRGRTLPNVNRFGDYISRDNFGVLDFDWDPEDPSVLLSIHGVDGEPLFAWRLWRSWLTFPEPEEEA